MRASAGDFFMGCVWFSIFAVVAAFGAMLLVSAHQRDKAAEDAMNAAHCERVFLEGGAGR